MAIKENLIEKLRDLDNENLELSLLLLNMVEENKSQSEIEEKLINFITLKIEEKEDEN